MYFCISYCREYSAVTILVVKFIENKETYGFKSKFMPKLTDELRELENEMFNLVKQKNFFLMTTSKAN